MKSHSLFWPVVFTAVISLFNFLISPVHALQPLSNEVVGVYELTDLDTKEGDLVVATTESGITRASQAYDNRLFGVAQNNAAIVYRRLDQAGQGIGIARNGTAVVNVSDSNGAILAGDYITSSSAPGVGQKATESGYVIGMALTAASGGQVVVSLRIEYAEINRAKSFGRLLDTISTAIFKNVQDPNKFSQIVRYIAAVLAILSSLVLGFITFSRAVPKAVEAIGRNPLAVNAIRFSMVINVILTVAIAAIGIIAAVIIIKI